MNREKRREKVIRTDGVKTKGWVKAAATLVVVAMFLMGILTGVLSK